MKKRLALILILLTSIFLMSCTKSMGPNRKNDALKRAKEYIKDKYGEELADAVVKRCTSSGEYYTYKNSYIVLDEALENPYNIVVHYNENGDFVDIGDDRESEAIRQAFVEWFTIDGIEPEAYAFGNCVDGGGENTIKEPIYYYYEKYDGNISDYIMNYNGVIYLSYDIESQSQNGIIKNRLQSIDNACRATIEVRTTVSRNYNMGLSLAVPTECLASFTLKNSELTEVVFKKKRKQVADGIIVSTYVDKTYKDMPDKIQTFYESQRSFIQKNNILLKTNPINDDGKKTQIAYQVGSGFEGHIEVAFLRSLFKENDVKVYNSDKKLIQPGTNNDRFYYDDDYFYYLVDPGYIITIAE